MSDFAPEGAVLQPARITAGGEALRRRLDRRNRLVAVVFALVFHLIIAGGFWLVDHLGVREFGDWSGPVLVKIGVPEAPPALDSSPIPEVAEPAVNDAAPEAAPEVAPPSSVDPPLPSESVAVGERTPAPEGADVSGPPSSGLPPSPTPARVQGSEEGNNYVMDFDGSHVEIGRAGAYEFIASYMPLPEFLDAESVENAVEYLKMSPDSIRGEIELYWEPFRGDYAKKPHPNGTVPMADRPYYWSLLINSLGYDIGNSDWKSMGMRPVVVEFSVTPSQGARGAELTDFELISRTNDPQVDQAVLYGVSRWVYYNNTERPIRGRMTYNFGS